MVEFGGGSQQRPLFEVYVRSSADAPFVRGEIDILAACWW